MAEAAPNPNEDPAPNENPAPDPAPEPDPAPDPDPEPEPASLLEDPGEPGPVASPADFPDDWREKLAGDDDKQLNHLKRFASPAAYHANNLKLQGELTKIKQGKADANPFPDDGTDEEKAAWRKDAGLPEESTGYLENYTLDDGLVIGEEDHEMVNKYLDFAHQRNLPSDLVKQTIAFRMEEREAEAAERRAEDETDKVSTRDELRDEMGADFQRNMSAAYGLLQTAPEDMQKQLLGGRLADGTAIGNSPDVLRWLTNVALDVNPAATVVPGGGDHSMASIDGEIAEIQKRIREDRRGYFSDEAAQARLAELLAAKEKLEARGAA